MQINNKQKTSYYHFIQLHDFIYKFKLAIKAFLVVSLLLSTVNQAQNNQNNSNREVSISFKEANIMAVLESVAEITGKSFAVDPKAKGKKITIISPKPLAADLLYEVFLAALQIHDLQVVKDGAIYRVLTLNKAYRVADTGVGNSLQTQVIPLKFTLANNVVSSIRPLMSTGALLQAHVESNSLIVNDTASHIERIKQVVSKLDRSRKDNLEVVTLTYITAGEILRIVKELKLDKDERINIVEDDINNRLLISGPQQLRELILDLVVKIDTPLDHNSNIDVLYVHYLDAKVIKTMIEQMLDSGAFGYAAGAKVAKDKQKRYSIQVDEGNNALVLAGSQEMMTSVRRLVTRLDRPRVQVLIEAVIAEVSQEQARNLSSQLAVGGSAGAGLIDFDSALSSIAGAAFSDNATSTESLSAIGEAVATKGLSLGGLLLGDQEDRGIALLVRALKTNTHANILSTPSIVTLDNEEASISVGQEVPFLTGSYTSSTSGSNNPFQTIQRKEVGISLKVTPQVNEGDAVLLKIEQESSNLLTSSEDVLQQITAKRTISTNVMVYDEQLLVLGGLIDQSDTHSASKVPLLGDIPLLGRLFKSTGDNQKNKVLMVFIRPTIMRSKGEAGKVSLRKYNYLRSYQEEYRGNDQAKSNVINSLEALKGQSLKNSSDESSPDATQEPDTQQGSDADKPQQQGQQQ